ncbi:MAG: sugar phosphate isomerase/epimerase [Bryobacterales bacterium]|nr:sugar phosphate isomerase/epimerase [Bryobacterales bacterium]
MNWTRREFGRTALAGLAAAGKASAAVDSTIAGVRIGNMTYSFRDMPLDGAIEAQAKLGIGFAELDHNHVERELKLERTPEGRRKLREWRLSPAAEMEYKAIRRKFERAGVPLWGLIYTVRDDFTEPEIERGFQLARALGVGVVTGSSTVSVIPRVAPFAEKYRMPYGVHGHSNVKDPNEFATPESFAKALAVSRWIRANLDIGHFFAAGYDPVEWIRNNHARISNIDLCDRKRNQGPQVAWGEGDTPVREVLLLMKREKYSFPATIQYEYQGTADSLTEVKRCFDYCKEVLAG